MKRKRSGKIAWAYNPKNGDIIRPGQGNNIPEGFSEKIYAYSCEKKSSNLYIRKANGLYEFAIMNAKQYLSRMDEGWSLHRRWCSPKIRYKVILDDITSCDHAHRSKKEAYLCKFSFEEDGIEKAEVKEYVV